MKALEKVSAFFGNTFAVWVLLIAVAAFVYPQGFTWIGNYIVWALGIIMFGMGLTLSGSDFKEVAKRPKDVAIGVAAQFLIMPALAFGLATLLPLSPQVAVGVILVGCCPGGTASNVMTYLAKGDTALSVAVTSVSTVLAPILTPSLILLFASKWLPVSPGDLFISIAKMIIIPIALGIIVKMSLGKKVEAGVKVLPLFRLSVLWPSLGRLSVEAKSRLHPLGLLFSQWLFFITCLDCCSDTGRRACSR